MAVQLDKLSRIVAVQWDNHPLLALDSGGVMGTSDDGIAWTKVEGYTGPVLRIGAWANDMFLAANPATGQLRKSFDGHSWETVPGNPFVGQLVMDIIGGDDRFLVVALDAATQKVVTVAVLREDEDGNDVWSDTLSPPLSGASFTYNGAGFSAGEFFIIGSEGFSGTFRDVIGYDFSLNEPIYSNFYDATWRKSRLTRSVDGLSWGALEDPFNAIDGGTSGTVTITNPAPPNQSVTIPRTDPDVSQATTDCEYIAQKVPEGGSVVVAQQTNVPAQSFAVYRGGSWSISPSDVRNVFGGLAYGSVTLPGTQTPVDRFIAQGTNDADFGYLTSQDGLTWEFTVQAALPVGAGALDIVFAEDLEEPLFVTAKFGSIYYSSDGTSWTEAGAEIGATQYTMVVY